MNLVFALSLLLTAGFALARLARLLRLPSVTGYICAGILLGPSGLHLIPAEVLESDLQVFTNIALLLVAFGIGERFDLQQLRTTAHALVRVSFGEIGLTFVLVGGSVGVAAWLSGTAADGRTALAVALVCAAISVETAAASTVSVIREAAASGPLSRIILSDLVVNNAMAVTLFGIAAAIAHVLLGTGPNALLVGVLGALLTTGGSLALGVVVGLVSDLVVHRLQRRADVLVAALAAVFLCGGLATYLGLSPLLAGVAAGFAVVNRDRRDVRAFRALNDFEPPLYGIFFALAGAQLHVQELVASGLIGLVFVAARAVGKYLGAWGGARCAGLDPGRARLLGLGLLPQAGLAVGLAYLVRQDPGLEAIRTLVINMVLASVVINELLGPPLLRLMLLRTGELTDEARDRGDGEVEPPERQFELVPWTWPKLTPPAAVGGSVVIAVHDPARVAGLTRIGVLLAHHYAARPVVVHVVSVDEPNDFWNGDTDQQAIALLRLATAEAENLGYTLDAEVEFADEVAEGIIRAAEDADAQAVVLGHPLESSGPRFGQVVDNVGRDALFPVIVVKFTGVLHTERILVPITTPEDYLTVHPVVAALASIEQHHITLLRLMPAEAPPSELERAEQECASWVASDRIPGQYRVRAVATASRVHEILEAARDHDIIVMAARTRRGLRRAFFGSLAEDVAQRAPCSMLLVAGGVETRSLEELEESAHTV